MNDVEQFHSELLDKKEQEEWCKKLVVLFFITFLIVFSIFYSLYERLYLYDREMIANPFTPEQIEQLSMTPCARERVINGKLDFTILLPETGLLTPGRLKLIEKICADQESIKRQAQLEALKNKFP